MQFLEPDRMNEQRIAEELVMLLESNGVAIRREPLAGGAGGLCTVNGKHIFFLGTEASSIEVASAAAEAIVKLIDIESIYLRPEIRQFIESHGS